MHFFTRKSNRSLEFIFCILISLHQGLVRKEGGRIFHLIMFGLTFPSPAWLEANAYYIERAIRATELLNFYSRYYPDKEIIFWTIDGKTEAILCSIEVKVDHRIQNISYGY